MPRQPKHPAILALDPGLRELGYAVLAGKQLLVAGVLPLRLTAPTRRLVVLREHLVRWLRSYRPRTLVIEQVPMRPLDSLAGLPALGKMLRRVGRRRRLPVQSYSAKSVRQSLIGNGWAGKREVAEALSSRFPELKVHLTQNRKWKEAYWQNMYDAVALALHHQMLHQPPSRSR